MITTERLVLRRWRQADREPYAAMMADPEVGYWLGGTQTREQSVAAIERFEDGLENDDHGFLAVERRIDGLFVGAVELLKLNSALPPAPGFEIGWRFARPAWGMGLATEAARALIHDGFTRLNLPEIVAFTAESNIRSRTVMERIGMERDAARDFDHPNLAPDHPLRRHVVYAITP